MRSAVLTLVLAFLVQSPDATIPKTGRTFAEVEGKGVQIYRCAKQGTDSQWIFQAPKAVLSDPATHTQLGTHGAGPSWVWKDGSSIQGKVLQKIPSPDPNSIPWLLLEAIQNLTHAGFLTATTYIRRSETRGGNAPAAGCDLAHTDAILRIPYTATYTFYTAE